jgi:AcrR family transcriptional regulator
MGRDAVARHQRARIYGGMVESTYQRGYAATSVAHVIALAGVSRRAFYEQFSNKEECFLSTYDAIVASSRKRVLRAWMSDRGWANRLYAALQAFLIEIAHDPRGAHLVLIECPSMGRSGHERTRLTATAFERIVATGFSLSPDRIALPALAPRAIVGGVRLVVARRLRTGSERELAGLTDELLDWISSYRSSSVARLRTLGSTSSPQLPVRQVCFLGRKDRRSLLMDALVQLSLEDGYMNVSDADIARHAGTSVESFHREFHSREECLLAVVGEFVAEAHDAVWCVTRAQSSWPEAVHAGVRALVGFCAAHPGLVKLSFVDMFEAGNGTAERLSGLLNGFLRVMVRSVPDSQRAPSVAGEAILGAVWAILSSYAPHDRLRYLPCLVDHLTYLVLAPYIGPRAAVEAIEAVHDSPRQLHVS